MMGTKIADRENLKPEEKAAHPSTETISNHLKPINFIDL